MPLSDPEIRSAFRSSLLPLFATDPGTLVVEELGLQHGRARIDLAIINGKLLGFELKSDLDTLHRLPEQTLVYNSVFDKITLVATEKHRADLVLQLPEWWGITIARFIQDAVQFEEIRPAQINSTVEKMAVARLLWRSEALDVLQQLGSANGVLSKPRAEIYKRLSEVLDTDTLRSKVRQALCSRSDWRPDALQM